MGVEVGVGVGVGVGDLATAWGVKYGEEGDIRLTEYNTGRLLQLPDE